MTDIQTPFGSGKITSLGTWGSIILSVAVTLIALAFGQTLAKKAEAASGGKIDATIDPIIAKPATNVRQREVL